jgi:hypothetical protein
VCDRHVSDGGFIFFMLHGRAIDFALCITSQHTTMGCDGEEHGDFEGEGDGGSIFSIGVSMVRSLVFGMLIVGPSYFSTMT